MGLICLLFQYVEGKGIEALPPESCFIFTSEHTRTNTELGWKQDELQFAQPKCAQTVVPHAVTI
eukprot:12415926-Karenia_brevis.AAC.1